MAYKPPFYTLRKKNNIRKSFDIRSHEFRGQRIEYEGYNRYVLWKLADILLRTSLSIRAQKSTHRKCQPKKLVIMEYSRIPNQIIVQSVRTTAINYSDFPIHWMYSTSKPSKYLFTINWISALYCTLPLGTLHPSHISSVQIVYKFVVVAVFCTVL